MRDNAVRDDRRAETHFVGFILRGAHTGKLSYINQLSAIGSGNLKVGKPEEEEEQKGGGERMSEPKKRWGRRKTRTVKTGGSRRARWCH